MKSKILTLVLIAALFGAAPAYCENFRDRFNDLLSKGDFAAQEQLLKKWEKADQDDAELYVAYFNYYAGKSRDEIVRLDKNKPDSAGGLAVTDKDGKNKEPSAYLYSDISYDTKTLSKGFEWADKGIAKYPDRLDIRFGKVYMYGEIKDYANFTEEIIKIIEYSGKNKNKWTWTGNQPVENPEKFMLDTIQQYQVQLFHTETDANDANMRKIAETVLKYYPDSVESLSDLAIVFMIRKEYDKALYALGRAEKIAPQDTVVLNNTAKAYALKGDTAKAEKYYKLVEKYGSGDEKQYALEQIKELKNK